MAWLVLMRWLKANVGRTELSRVSFFRLRQLEGAAAPAFR